MGKWVFYSAIGEVFWLGEVIFGSCGHGMVRYRCASGGMGLVKGNGWVEGMFD